MNILLDMKLWIFTSYQVQECLLSFLYKHVISIGSKEKKEKAYFTIQDIISILYRYYKDIPEEEE